MAISEHLSATLVSSYLQGRASPGAALAAEAHLALCEQCAADPRLRAHTAPPAGATGSQAQLLVGLLALNDGYGINKRPALPRNATARSWRQVVSGVHVAALRGVSGLGEAVHLLVGEAGARLVLPACARLLVVLRGVVRTAGGAYARGDIVDAAGVALAEATTDGECGCLCLVVGDADMYPNSLLDRIRSAGRGVSRGKETPRQPR
jgi:anti-sigma factor ChrR (cupin superfamily)